MYLVLFACEALVSLAKYVIATKTQICFLVSLGLTLDVFSGPLLGIHTENASYCIYFLSCSKCIVYLLYRKQHFSFPALLFSFLFFFFFDALFHHTAHCIASYIVGR